MVTQPKQLYRSCGCHPSLDFVNSLDRTLDKAPKESLFDYADLTLWSAQACTLPAARAKALASAARRRPHEAAMVFERAVALREAIFRIFEADMRGRRPAPADLENLNSELAEALAHARVEATSAGFAWSWAQEPEELGEPLWPLARSAAELLVSPNRALVKQCASDTCRWLFLDRTKNHKRRWCDMRICGNRAKVRLHRQRQRSCGKDPGE